MRVVVALSALILSLGFSLAHASERLVIEFSDRAVVPGQAISMEKTPAMVQRLHEQVSRISGANSKLIRVYGERALIVEGTEEQISKIEQRMGSDPAVNWTARDRRIRVKAQSPLIGLINALDPTLQARSWQHRTVSSQPASMNTFGMWDITHGSAPAVVAVLDTGVLMDHPMLQGHLLQGYDFVSDAFVGNDGQSTAGSDRDADPSDPGDGTTFADVNQRLCAFASPSTWHGTFVSGLIAGSPVPSEGIFPVGYNTTILPVRVLGRCGGFSSDLADGIRWAAGLPVAGAPTNPNPARVINLSLGAQGGCVGAIEGAAVTAARNAGALVIAAAGNDGTTVDSPANCPGVVGVGATDQEGLKASYSNFGPEVDISAPGGDSAFPLWSAGDSGATAPAGRTYRNKVGTSFSSALVSGAAGAVLAVKPDIGASELENALVSSVRPFLSINGALTCQSGQSNLACNCTTATCGFGMLDAGSLVAGVASGSNVVNLLSDDGNVTASGGSLVFTGSTSNGGAVNFQIGSVVKTDGANDPTVSVANNQATVTFPAGVSSALLQASNGGSQAIAALSTGEAGPVVPSLVFSLLDSTANVIGSDPSAPAPVASDSDSSPQGDGAAVQAGGGGGGSMGLLGLWLFALLAIVRKCLFLGVVFQKRRLE